MITYILEKKRLFLILLQSLAVFCQLFAGLSSASANSIIPKAKTEQPAMAVTLMPKSVAAATAPKASRAPVKKKASPASKVCTEFLAANAAAKQQPEYAALPEKEVTGEPAPSNEIPAAVASVYAATLEDVFSALTEANHFRQIYEASKERKEEDKKVFLDKAAFYISKLKAFLNSKGIQTKDSELAPELQSELQYSWPTLVISADNEHRLSRFAAGLKRRYDTELVVDFLWLARSEAGAAFLPNSNKLIISSDALRNERASIKEMHEVLHVRFKAQREQREEDAGSAPLQMFYLSYEAIKSSQNFFHNYEFEMTFEEIWTHSYELGFLAAQLDQTATPEKLYELQQTVEALVGISESADAAAEKAKLIQLEKSSDIETINKVSYATFKEEDQFLFAVALPKDVKDDAAREYAVNEINQAQRLSRFIQDYWAQLKTLKPDEFLKKSQDYRNALIEFVKKDLNSGRSTAEATYDLLAYFNQLDALTGNYSSEQHAPR